MLRSVIEEIGSVLSQGTTLMFRKNPANADLVFSEAQDISATLERHVPGVGLCTETVTWDMSGVRNDDECIARGLGALSDALDKFCAKQAREHPKKGA